MVKTRVPDTEVHSSDPADLSIDLKDPSVAAMLAWLVPGLGHWYQGRRPKAILFFVCILGTFLYGLYLGEGRVVYASWRPNDHRKPYFCQIGVGLAAMPALVQAQRFRSPQLRADVAQRAEAGKARFWDWFMAPPQVGDEGFGQNDRSDELDALQKRLNRFFELGTVFTMIAGLLNVLAIYDACCGPAASESIEEERRQGPGGADPQPSTSSA